MSVAVAVVGGGYMGTGIAQVLALAGHTVRIADVDEEAARVAVDRCRRDAEALEAAGGSPPGSARCVDRRVSAATLESAVAPAGYVVEAVPEQPALKARVHTAIEAATAPDAIIATNTSAIPISALARSLTHPGRFVGNHWFNPAPLVPCVEVIAHPGTDAAVIESTLTLLRAAGKRPTVVGDGPGFVGNRLQFALFREAAAIVADGLASPEAVDAVVRSSFGFRLPFLGPFAIADVAGLDVYAGAFASLAAGLGDAHGAPSSLTALVDAGQLGLKTGGGYHSLPAPESATLVAWRDRSYVALTALLDELGEPPSA